MKNNFPPVEEQIARLKEVVEPVEIIDEDLLAARLVKSRNENKPLRIKQGFDASAPDLHLGHAVSLWKLRTFQDLGHKVIFLIGDFTGMVGDPSGRSKTRPRLTREEVEAYAQTYREQVFRILDPDMTELRFNSEWHAKRDIYRFLELAGHYTVRRMLERDDFWKRFQAEEPISMLEFLYPLIQAYDSVALEADVEVGGLDQKFNLVLTRHIQRAYGHEPQVLFLMPLLRGTDGREKMSKSLGNCIGITDPPDEMYGKVMSISDELLEEYYRLGNFVNYKTAKQMNFKEEQYKLKHSLAFGITRTYHGKENAESARVKFLTIFRDKKWPSFDELRKIGLTHLVPESGLNAWLPQILKNVRAASSRGKATRLIEGGGVYFIENNNVRRVSIEEIYAKTADEAFYPHLTTEQIENLIENEGVKNLPRLLSITKPVILKVGKRRFYLLYSHEDQLQDLS